MTNLPEIKKTPLQEMLNRSDVKTRFREILGKKAPGFISSIISAVGINEKLRDAAPGSVVSSAAIAATLDLPINPSLGMAHLVPYSGKCQFQMGWKGFVQLAMRSGQYRTMNVALVHEGEIKSHNRITGEMVFGDQESDEIIGYVAYFRLLNGFEKYFYMKKKEVEQHGQRYSKSFSNPKGRWQQDFNSMAMKTVLKMLLSKFGILSIEMQTAIQHDQAIFNNDDSFGYDDSPTGKTSQQDAESPFVYYPDQQDEEVVDVKPEEETVSIGERFLQASGTKLSDFQKFRGATGKPMLDFIEANMVAIATIWDDDLKKIAFDKFKQHKEWLEAADKKLAESQDEKEESKEEATEDDMAFIECPEDGLNPGDDMNVNGFCKPMCAKSRDCKALAKYFEGLTEGGGTEGEALV